MSVYLPLNGPGKRGPAKAPSAKRWSDEAYPGVELDYGGWVGLRCDDLVVVDCDSEEAAALWRSLGAKTHEVKTPRGHHFYYAMTPGSPDAPAVGIMPGVDIRAGRGSQVVIPPTPGYTELDRRRPAPFQPRWLVDVVQSPEIGLGSEEWDQVPEGRRNDTLVALAGALRRQGMSIELIYRTLRGWNASIVDPPLDDEELEIIARSVGRYDPEPDFAIEVEDESAPLAELDLDKVLTAMSGMTLPPPAEWYWRPYFPVGRLVLVDGSEGIGKGLLGAHLATMLAHQHDTPILWASTEDDPEEDIQRRLLAAGYLRGKDAEVWFFDAVHPRFPGDTKALEHIIAAKGAGLLILDPGRSFLAPPDGVKASYNEEAAVRPGLEALNRMAKKTGCTVMFVHHWNKNTSETVQYRSGGSAAFAQIVRHRVTLAWSGPTDGGQGAFEVSKSNIGPKGHVHSYTVVGHPDPALDTAYFQLGEPLPHASLGEWMKEREDEEKGVPIDEGGDVEGHLRELTGGTLVPKIEDLARELKVSLSDAREARDALIAEGVLRRGGQGGRQVVRAGEGERG